MELHSIGPDEDRAVVERVAVPLAQAPHDPPVATARQLGPGRHRRPVEGLGNAQQGLAVGGVARYHELREHDELRAPVEELLGGRDGHPEVGLRRVRVARHLGEADRDRARHPGSSP
jgi:hypothetical protein